MIAGKLRTVFLFFGLLINCSRAYAAPQPVTAAPPTDACPDQGLGFYGFTGGYCLDKNKDGVSYLTLSTHSVHVGESFELTLYTDEGRGYAAQGTALFPSVHWNCVPNDFGCSDTPFNPIVPGIRYADPTVSGPSTESNPVILFDSVACPGTADQCQDGWLKHLNSEGRITYWTRSMKPSPLAASDRDIWHVITAGTEAEDYLAILTDEPCPFADTNNNKVDDCQVTADLKAQVQKLAKLVGKLSSSSAKKDTKAVSSLLKSILSQVSAKHDDIDTQDGLPFDDQVSAMNSSVKKALKVGSKSFLKDKKDAKKKIQVFIAALAVSNRSK